MRKFKFNEISAIAQIRNLGLHLLPPLESLYFTRYLGNVECEYHLVNLFFTSLITEGEIIYQEREGEEIVCRRNDLLLIPPLRSYCWKTRTPVSAVQCCYYGFNSYEHGLLGSLFGSRHRLEKITLPDERRLAFEQKLAKIQAGKFSDIHYSAALLELFADALEYIGERQVEPGCSQTLNRCICYIENSLNKQLDVAEIAKAGNISERRLFQLFQEAFGMPPLRYAANRKLEYARRLLGIEELSNEEIADRLGFSSANYFIRFFKKNTGLTPMEFRRQNIDLRKSHFSELPRL